jgi:hypothetical protein
MKFGNYKIFISLFLSLVIIIGPCLGQDRTDREDRIRHRQDSTTYREDRATPPVIITRDELTVYREDLTTYLEERVYYRFGEYIDGIYVIDLQTQEYIDAHIILDNGTVLDIGQIVGDLAIGAAAIVITAIVMPVLVPTIATKTVIAITVVNTTGAVLSGAIAGTVEYVRTGGDLNRALMSAASEFKYTSIFSSVGEISSLALLYRIAPSLRATRFAGMMENAVDIVNRLEPNQLHRQINSAFPCYSQINSAGQIDSVFSPVLGIRQGPRPDWTMRSQYIDWLRRQGIPNNMLNGDEAGHLIASILGGSSYWDNIVPMSHRLNHGKWRQMENFLHRTIMSGKSVENFYIKVIRATPTGRPMAFRVEYDIDGRHFIQMFSNSP